MSISDDYNTNFNKLLDESVKTHGHLCPGQVLGVRMSMLGLNLLQTQLSTRLVPTLGCHWMRSDD